MSDHDNTDRNPEFSNGGRPPPSNRTNNQSQNRAENGHQDDTETTASPRIGQMTDTDTEATDIETADTEMTDTETTDTETTDSHPTDNNTTGIKTTGIKTTNKIAISCHQADHITRTESLPTVTVGITSTTSLWCRERGPIEGTTWSHRTRSRVCCVSKRNIEPQPIPRNETVVLVQVQKSNTKSWGADNNGNRNTDNNIPVSQHVTAVGSADGPAAPAASDKPIGGGKSGPNVMSQKPGNIKARKRRERLKGEGLCQMCGKAEVTGNHICDSCYKKRRERDIENHRRKAEINQCRWCKRKAMDGRKLCEEHYRKQQKWNRDRAQRDRDHLRQQRERDRLRQLQDKSKRQEHATSQETEQDADASEEGWQPQELGDYKNTGSFYGGNHPPRKDDGEDDPDAGGVAQAQLVSCS
ncbi:hypothetical protein B0T20DRAFT_392452 [Sordaria brevicollis]|uniref:Uncharacterized protein n=1 Tax=Sordaria brevicollis TaxID=83679 RepID=A0AAE0PGJ2_SORBR|nr:hypothetical protein B0T20DRAFT_392452 [Sordaria brevicollis]